MLCDIHFTPRLSFDSLLLVDGGTAAKARQQPPHRYQYQKLLIIRKPGHQLQHQLQRRGGPIQTPSLTADFAAWTGARDIGLWYLTSICRLFLDYSEPPAC